MSDQPLKANIKVRQVKSGLQAYIDLPTKKGSQPAVLGEAKLSTELAGLLAKSPKQLEGKEVEYLIKNGQVQRVWEAGKAWDRPETPPSEPPPRGGGRTPRPGVRHGDQRQRLSGNAPHNRYRSRNTGQEGTFENPYNFIPALPRRLDDPHLGDKSPDGHHRYQPKRWTGRIRLQLTTKTPLLVPDLGKEQESGHKVFGLRLDDQDKPVLPPTTIKGPLRVAYEAITNSRMGVLEPHDERLALRMPAPEGLSLVPCRVVAAKSGNLEAMLLPGLSEIGDGGKPTGRREHCLMYAAWLPRYKKYTKNSNPARDKHEGQYALRYPNRGLPSHGDHVFVRTERRPHRTGRFSFLAVTEIQKAAPGASCPAGWNEGYVFVSGRNIMNKHEERVFLVTPRAITLAIEDPHLKGWKRLISDYQSIHRDEIADRNKTGSGPSDYLGHEPGSTGFSRHVYTPGADDLTAGVLCYARIETDSHHAPKKLVELYPVSITRMLYADPPIARLSYTLLPPRGPADLSPADRDFGWVNQDGNGSYKGKLRIGTVTCEDGLTCIQRFDPDCGIPLAILGQPKPSQARFYAARNPQGDALPLGVEKKSAYKKEGGLRGRKVYPHQSQAELPEYWTPAEDVTVPLHDRLKGRKVYREWQSRAAERSDQNRSIKGWIKAETRFSFDLEVINLTDVELGALLWLLVELQEGYLRVGGGKPLGFGSAKLQSVRCDLADGDALAAKYRAFGAEQTTGRRIRDASQANELISTYKSALVNAIGQPARTFDDLSIIKAFRNAARGGDLPTHYPRTDEQRGPVGESYKWFVKNEASDNRRHERHSLPGLDADDRGLPTLIENPGD